MDISTNWRVLIEGDVIPSVLLLSGLLICGFLFSILRATAGMRTEPVKYFVVFDAVVAVVGTIMSGRDIGAAQLAHNPPSLIRFTQAATVLLLIIAAERVFRFIMLGEYKRVKDGILLLAVIVFFITTNFVAPLLGRNPDFGHKLFQAPILILAVLALALDHREDFVAVTRNVLIAFLAIGLIAIAIAPDMVMDFDYSEGFVPGLKIRYYGFATHPNSLAVYAFLLMCLLWMQPIRGAGISGFAWLVVWLSLFLTQSKTSLLIAVTALVALWAVRHGRGALRAQPQPFRMWRRFALGGLVASSGISMLFLMALLFGLIDPSVIERRLDYTNFWTLTGRIRIWQVSLSDLWDNPLFGYGGDLWNRQYQQAKGVFVAHAHNQYVHTLGDNGFIGLATLLLYCCALGVAAWRARANTFGVSVCLALFIFLRGITEAPLIIDTVYGPEILTHVTLLVLCISPALGPSTEEYGRVATDGYLLASASAKRKEISA